MSYNNSLASLCNSNQSFPVFLYNIWVYDTAMFNLVALMTCTVNLLLAPVAIAGNALVLAAIRQSSSLKTPSYLLLGGLAFTDFFTSLFIQPLCAVNILAELKGSKKLFCVANRILDQVGPYFFIVTMEIITFMPTERWLHMSQRSLITNGRVYKVLGVFLILPILYLPFGIFRNILVFVFGIMCLVLTSVAYYKVFKFVRHHQQQVQTNQQAIDAAKYRKSVFTIFFILLLFLVSYMPNWLCLAVLSLFASKLKSLYVVVLYVTATVLFSSSSLNPILYCWRIKELRSAVMYLLKALFCHC